MSTMTAKQRVKPRVWWLVVYRDNTASCFHRRDEASRWWQNAALSSVIKVCEVIPKKARKVKR